MAHTNFVIEELRGHGASIAKHRFGCRVLCRLLEYSNGSASLAELLENEVLQHAHVLACHPFAHYVIEEVLEFGCPEHRAQTAAALRDSVSDLAQHRHASHVVESALQFCSIEDQRALADRILADGIVSLAQCRFGARVVDAILRLPAEGPKGACRQKLRAGAAQLQETKHGLRVLRSAGLRPATAAAA